MSRAADVASPLGQPIRSRLRVGLPPRSDTRYSTESNRLRSEPSLLRFVLTQKNKSECATHLAFSRMQFAVSRFARRAQAKLHTGWICLHPEWIGADSFAGFGSTPSRACAAGCGGCAVDIPLQKRRGDHRSPGALDPDHGGAHVSVR